MKNKLTRGLLCLLILGMTWFATSAQAYTTTTNYLFQLPQVNNAIDQNQWGAELNLNFTNLDALLLTASNTVVTAISTNTVLTNSNQNQLIKVDATSGNVLVTLQAAATAGSGFRVSVKKIDSSAHTVTVQGNASELIDSANTYVETAQYNSVNLVSDGTQWWRLAEIVPAVSVPAASTSTAGILKLSTNAQALAGVDSTTAVTPSALAYVTGLFFSASSSKIVLGTITIEWGTGTGGSAVTFPTAFSSTFYAVTANVSQSNVAAYVAILSPTSSGFTPQCANNSALPFYWIAIGPT